MQASAGTVLREWGRLGWTAFGGPPTHIALLRDLCVTRRGWMTDTEFEDALAACNLLPGPASTQMAIFCAWRVRGRPGAVLGGLGFVVPGLLVMLALAALFLADTPPDAIQGAAAGAGAAVAAVAVQAGWSLVPGSLAAGAAAGERVRWGVYLGLGALAAATIGPWLVLVLLACGVVEVAWRRAGRRRRSCTPGRCSPPPRRGSGGCRARVGRLQGRRALLRGRLRDHPADAGATPSTVPLDDRRAVPQRGRAGPGHPRAVVHTVAVVGYAAAGLGGGAARGGRRVLAVVRVRPARRPRFDDLRGDAASARSSTARARPRSARSSARPSPSPPRWPSPGRPPSSRPPRSSCSSRAAGSW